MTAFVLAAALLVALALAFVLPPLWRGSRVSAFALVLTLPLAAGLLYALVGTPGALDPQARQAPTLDGAVDRLAAELERDPDNAEGWRLLGRSRKTQERYAEARAALERAHALAPEDPDLMVEYAEAITLASATRRIEGEASTLIDRALAKDPDNQRGLWFLGIRHMQAGEPAQAAAAWEKLLPRVDAATAEALRPQIAQARAAAGPPPAAQAAPAAAADAAAGLHVTVELAPALRERIAAGDTLFVFARQPGGPPMPVAVKKLPAKEFPTTVQLSDADSPMPTMKLSQLDRVEVVARVSRSGAVAAQPGDLEATPLQVAVKNTAPVALRIERVVE